MPMPALPSMDGRQTTIEERAADAIEHAQLAVGTPQYEPVLAKLEKHLRSVNIMLKWLEGIKRRLCNYEKRLDTIKPRSDLAERRLLMYDKLVDRHVLEERIERYKKHIPQVETMLGKECDCIYLITKSSDPAIHQDLHSIPG